MATLQLHIPLDPCHEKVDDPPLSLGGNSAPARHLPPLGEAVAAAARAGVLCFEHGMPAHWRLPAVVGRIGRRKTRSDEVLAMGADRLHPLLCDVLPVRSREMEATPELCFREDDSRVRNENAAQNLNVIRKVAIDLLKADRTTRHTFKKKLRTMMWNDEMLQHIIIGK